MRERKNPNPEALGNVGEKEVGDRRMAWVRVLEEGFLECRRREERLRG